MFSPPRRPAAPGLALILSLLLASCASSPAPEAYWRDHEVVVITSEQLSLNTIQTPGLIRAEAISRAMAGAEKL
jgi:hypothetical protein